MGLLTQLRSAGLRLRAQGDQLLVEPKTALTDELRAMIRANKVTILGELLGGGSAFSPAQEQARQTVLERLAAHPEVQRAIDARFEDDVLIVALAVRDIGTCELRIPAACFDRANLASSAALLTCLDQVDGRA